MAVGAAPSVAGAVAIPIAPLLDLLPGAVPGPSRHIRHVSSHPSIVDAESKKGEGAADGSDNSGGKTPAVFSTARRLDLDAEVARGPDEEAALACVRAQLMAFKVADAAVSAAAMAEAQKAYELKVIENARSRGSPDGTPPRSKEDAFPPPKDGVVLLGPPHAPVPPARRLIGPGADVSAALGKAKAAYGGLVAPVAQRPPGSTVEKSGAVAKTTLGKTRAKVPEEKRTKTRVCVAVTTVTVVLGIVFTVVGREKGWW